ncbi:MAG: nucleotidyl transferase AbiEii/AbiGii toxin family protein [Candidatus Wallbacteria bacterium]|nr:nucleotidyl transferase AbiEii/AbiGii toxin family protein [Candidatus Wallbacteria bacterium]
MTMEANLFCRSPTASLLFCLHTSAGAQPSTSMIAPIPTRSISPGDASSPKMAAALFDVTRVLDALEIAYMLTGSMALSLYVMPRMTRDLDLVVEIGSDQAQALCRALEATHCIDERKILDAIAHRFMFNVIRLEPPVKLDFVIRKSAPYRTMEFGRRRRMEIDGQALWVVSPEDLLLAKLFWAKAPLGPPHAPATSPPAGLRALVGEL